MCVPDLPASRQVFAYVHGVLGAEGGLSAQEKDAVRRAVHALFTALAAIDPEATAKLVLLDLGAHLPQVSAF